MLRKSPLEISLAEAWSAVLHVEKIGLHDNFFELGGDSLQATILLNRLREELDETLAGHLLFEAQTIGALAAYLGRQQAGCRTASRAANRSTIKEDPRCHGA